MATANRRDPGPTAKQPGQGKPYPVQIGQETYGVRAQTDPQKSRFWQSVLGRAKTADTPVHCLCLVDERVRQLSVHERDGRYHLQAFPNQGESHAKECRFHRDATGPKNAFPETTDDPAQDDTPRDRLPLGFAMPTHSPSMGGAGSGGPRNSPRINRVSLEYLLIKLWHSAGLNEWKESWAGKRNTFTVLNRLRTAATEIEINGELLAQNLVIGETNEGGKADGHNAAVIKRATEARRRILVLGRLAAAKRQDQPLSPLLLRNFRGAPFLLMSAEVTHIAEGKYGPAIAAWRHAAQPVFTLAMVEPGDRGRWFVADVGFLACDERFIAGSGH